MKTGYLAGRYPGRVGLLFGPGGERGPFSFAPYALDNNAFRSFKTGCAWDRVAWLGLLEWARRSGQAPLWAIVPDVVGDRSRTLKNWRKYAPVVARLGFPLAFAVQDGMTKRDVPHDTDVVFVGGSTEWKWKTARAWCDAFPRVHVGRVNSFRRLWDCHTWGAESTDGTGFVRREPGRYEALLGYFALAVIRDSGAVLP